MAKSNNSKVVCPGCGEEIKPDDKKFMLVSDTPYINIWMHRDCYEKIRGDKVWEKEVLIPLLLK